METLQRTAVEAQRFLDEGTPGVAELILREALAADPRDHRAWAVLAGVADAIGDAERATRFRQVAVSLDLTKPLTGHDSMPWTGPVAAAPATPDSSTERFLLIKAWGYGFFSDLDHVLGCLLLCEMTGRTPVTHWGRNSLFRLGDGTDAFRSYFEPLSPCSVNDLTGKGLDFWPPKWRDANLLADNVQKQFGEFSRLSALHMLHRPERILVSDYHTGVCTLLPWLPPSHPMHGRSASEALRYLVAKYLRPRPDILAEVDAFAGWHFAARPLLAVHIRGSDKFVEDRQHEQKLAVIPQAIDFLAGADRNCGIFLLTDSSAILAQYQQRYGSRVVSTDCLRTESRTGLHYTGQPDKRRLGAEVLRDALLAARCDRFIGIGSSNVSCAINHLKEWTPGTTVLLGPLMTDRQNATQFMTMDQLKRFFSGDVLEAWRRGGVNT
jgi:hypothetical protein